MNEKTPGGALPVAWMTSSGEPPSFRTAAQKEKADPIYASLFDVALYAHPAAQQRAILTVSREVEIPGACAPQPATQARGALGVAVALLQECLDPLEVSAAIIEDEDGGEAIETLIAQVRKFCADAGRGLAGQSGPNEKGGSK